MDRGKSVQAGRKGVYWEHGGPQEQVDDVCFCRSLIKTIFLN
jgi:hypothetical protein